jgi:hypothetical protein
MSLSKIKELKSHLFLSFFLLNGFMIFCTEVLEELWKMYFSSANSTNFATEIWGKKSPIFLHKKFEIFEKKKKKTLITTTVNFFLKLKLKTMFATMDAKSEQMGLGSPMHQIRASKNE